ncbi:MAG TPA: hypothetical protein PLP31_13615 [Thermoanaerobaculaceae bacterium]|nr:hypothetical protein [Thermoanaerobaculaceae bacterium]
MALFTGSVALLSALALPSAANAYWACVLYEAPGCRTWEFCDEYYDHNDQPTGRTRVTLYRDVC